MKSDSFRLSEVAPRPSTLVELLRWRAQNQPDQQVYIYLDSDEAKKVSLTYRELDARARDIAARLQSVSARGERALLLYPPGLEFISAFFGCLYAGVIAVPAYPPRLNRNLLRVQAIIADATATVTMTTDAILSKVKTMMDHVPDLRRMRWLDTESTEAGLGGAWREPELGVEDLAFLQYTSGSTGSPKGVMLTHGNLLHNASLVYRALDHTPDDKYVSWLPTFHDMGFMAGVLQPLYGGFPVVLMSPAAFLQSPIRWLQAITEYGGTTSGGPNFAYDLCVRKITPAQRETLDLSSWSTAFNGAEPIRHETLERFVAAFEPCGFRREVFYPCYGLAEATLIVSGGRKSAPPVVKTFESDALGENRVAELASADDESARTLVGCGSALFEQRVAIVNPETSKLCAPDEVGEIWVSGPSVAQGYWNRPEQSEHTFRARLADTGEGPFLRTEDLGFLRDGELFVAGRIKDLVIIRGRNHYPQDIELTVERSHPALRAGCGAAFSVDLDDEERLVVVQEIESIPQAEAESAIEAIRKAVAEEHELQVYAVALIKPGSVPKTSSGKIQRHACRNDFLSGELKAVESSVLSASEAEPNKLSLTREELLGAPAASRQALLENYLQEQVSRVLKVRATQISPQLPLNTLGIDSLMSIELQYNIETTFGVSMPMASFLQDADIVSLAAQILAQLSSRAEPSPSSAHAGGEAAVRASSDTHPLSYGQQALWFLYHLAPESTAYNIARAVRILSPLDVRAFRAAFQQLVDRHPSLRTTFPAPDGRPVQHVHTSAEVSFEEVDAAAWTEEILKERLAEESQRPFDLASGPLFRLVLYTRSPQERVLLLAVHHIVADFWSLAVLMNELGILYKAQRAGAQATLPPAATDYVDYVGRQAEMLKGPEGARLWDYWREQLAGELPALDLPTDRPRPAVQTYRGSSQSILLPKHLTETLKSLGRARGATLYMTLLAAFQTLLHRYTGADDVSVGSTLTGRSRSELAGVVGYFVNPVVMRAKLSGDPTFEEFLGQVRQTVVGALEHQDYPFALLVEQLQPQRDPARSPLFQVMFILQKSHLMDEAGLASFALGEEGARLSLGELELASVSMEQRVAQFDLTLMMAEAGEGLAASLEYNADLFDGATVARMLRHFETLLESLAARPAQKLSGLSLLTADERQKLLVEWNDTRVERPRRRLLHELIEEQAASSPDAVAVIHDGRRLTYRELNGRANQLARHLQDLGAGPETRVGIMLERSPEMLPALLAVLKSGAAYVPLDPAYPQDRLSHILEDARPQVLLTQRDLRGGLPHVEARVVEVDAEWDAFSSQSAENLASDVTETNLAYVIYTSGSTGRPKGVMLPHGAVVNFMDSMRRRPGLSHEDRLLAVTTISFDIAGLELFLPLTVGASVVLVSREVAADGTRLIEHLEGQDITAMQATPATWRLLLEAGWAGSARLKILCGGEALAWDLAEQLVGRGASVWNMYGPTETTIWSAAREIVEADGRVLLGGPVANTQLYVLDRREQLLPLGAVGELHIGGEGLARGYQDLPALTAEKFIPDPFSAEPGARLYKTGDLVRFLPDGDLEFLGRTDHQVKVRGFRIELGEIESVLRQQPGVREAVVVLRGGPSGGDKRLVGYVVRDAEEDGAGAATAGGEGARRSELRERLRERLPEYMVPAVLVEIAEMPLTPSGKIDRKALPEVDGSRPELRQEYVAARNEMEAALCDVWGRVLGVERVGVHDNFFELGGDSILSIQLINNVRQAGIVLTPRQLFQHQTVARLAAVATLQRPEETDGREQTEQSGAQGSTAHATSDFASALPDKPTLDELARRYGPLEDIYPLSPIQSGMLFHSLYAPASGVYVQQLSLALRGALDAAAFERAWQEVSQRHATLRTAFVWENLDEPLQLVRRSASVPWETSDWRGLSAEEQRAKLDAHLEADRARGFELSEAPLMRMLLCRLTDETHQLVWSFHHLLLDGWSLPIILKEVLSLYEAARRGQELTLEPSRPYLDYVKWFRRQDLSEAEVFWRGSLAGFHAPTPLGLDNAASAEATPEGGHAEQLTHFSAAQTARLQTFARRHQLTLNTLLQGAWALLLGRYSGERDVVYGVTVSGRSPELAGAERMVGPFINTVPVRVSLPARAATLDWLRELQERQAELRDYEYTPLVQIQGWSEVPRGVPLFESIFVFENYPVDASLRDLRGELRIDGVAFFEQTNYPLTVQAVPGAELMLKLMYDPQRFDADTVSRILAHFGNLLDGIVSDPGRPAARLRLLSDDELTRLLTDWNDTRALYPRAKCLHQLFEEQAARTPESTALVFGETRLSYAELNARADRLARHLQALGVGPESLVAILLERSVEMVVALLAVLKAGAAYVPADLAYPRERLKFMLEDAQVAALLTDSRLTHVLPESEVKVICLDQLQDESSGAEDAPRPSAPVAEDNLAYVIYTSGSTGRPKGVAITHRSAVTLLHWSQQTWSKAELSGVLASTSICFDLSVFELFLPLSVGGRIILAENALQLPSLAAADEVTLVNTVPSAMTELVRSGALPPSVRVVNMAGEPLKQTLVEQVYEQPGVERVFNLYGPSEDTTYSTFAPVGRGGAPSIGRPVANTQAYLLDANLEPVPQGVVGELYLGGEGLARGYLNRADLTAEKFIPDPFSAEAGARLYGTGDLARYLPNGELEFLGRVDHQVKVRGFRIELGEVEARLVEQPGVREAVVVAREDAGGEKRLVGYVACAGGDAPSQSELRARLKERLPEYMVPSDIVLMDELPLTPNGKIDRKALPLPEGLRPQLTEELVAPRTPLEAALANIWKDVLGLKELGVRDNFFELGGHSLLAIQLVSRLHRALDVDLPLRDLMSATTVEEMARLLVARATAAGQAERLDHLAESLDEDGDDGDFSSRPRVIAPRRTDEELPLSFAQQRLWFLSQLQPDVSLYNCPGAVRLKGRLDGEALVRALSEIVRRHEILRTNFPVSEKGDPVQRILEPRPLVPRVVDLRHVPADEREEEARRFMVEEARKPFDLTRDDLLRVTLMNLDDDESVLMLTAHHITVDAWSMGVLVGELATLYAAFSTGRPSPLPELPIQYADFALWQREWLQGEVLAEQSRYWKRVLAGRLPVLELPVGRPRPRQRTNLGERRVFLIGPELTASLNKLSRAEGVTLYMTLLAAFQTLLHRYTKQDDIVVGTAVANRPSDEVEGLIGCFINTLAMRTDFSGNPRFRELLRQVREVSLGALSHQDMPFEKLVDELQPERSLGELPIVQVAFGIQNSPVQALELPEMKITPLDVDARIARLDLTLWIEESAEGLRAAWTYSTDLFDAQEIERMHTHYETLLRSIVARPKTAVDALEMLTEAEKEQAEAQGKRREESSYQRLLKVKPKAVSTPRETVKD